MEKENEKLELIQGSETQKGIISRVKDKATSLVDQNEDGEFNREDLSIIADSIRSEAKSTIVSVKTVFETKTLELERKALCPIMREDLEATGFSIPKLIRIAEMDKKHADSQACAGSIGYMSKTKDFSILTIYPEFVEIFGLTFYPDIESEIYYVDPTDRDLYLAMDQYYQYIQQKKVGEMNKVAQDLGATHFRVTYQEKRTSETETTAKTKIKRGKKTLVDASASQKTNEGVSQKILSECSFQGHPPVEPQLIYLKNEQPFHDLIRLRMDSNGPMSSQKLEVNLSKTYGIKEKDVLKIDAALKALKFNLGADISKQLKKEEQEYLFFEIEF